MCLLMLLLLPVMTIDIGDAEYTYRVAYISCRCTGIADTGLVTCAPPEYFPVRLALKTFKH